MSTKDKFFIDDDVSPDDRVGGEENYKGLKTNELSDAISVESIERRLRALPIDMAWGIFQKMNELLLGDPVWQRHVVGIHSMLTERMIQKDVDDRRVKKYLEKMAADPKVQNIYPQSGSTTNIDCNMDNPKFTIIDKDQGGET